MTNTYATQFFTFCNQTHAFTPERDETCYQIKFEDGTWGTVYLTHKNAQAAMDILTRQGAIKDR